MVALLKVLDHLRLGPTVTGWAPPLSHRWTETLGTRRGIAPRLPASNAGVHTSYTKHVIESSQEEPSLLGVGRLFPSVFLDLSREFS